MLWVITMQDHHSLTVYQESYKLCLGVYQIKFPMDERFAMQQQLRRSAVSVPSNIAESCGKDSQADFKRGLYISMGSLKEMETQIDLCGDLKYITSSMHKEFKQRIELLGKQLNSLIQKIKEEAKNEQPLAKN